MKMASRLIDLISKKTNCTCSTLFLVISKKQICTCSTLFCLSLALVFTLFCTTKTSNFLVTHYFYGGLSYVLTILCFLSSCSLYFSPHFSFSHRRFEFPCFSFYEIRLLCFQYLALTLSLLSTLV